MSNDKIDKFLREAGKEWDLERVCNIYKFNLFFTGLVFAIVSFAMQFPVKSACLELRIAEGCSWALFLITGICALYVCGGFVTKHTDSVLRKREEKLPLIRFWMWVLFIVAIVVLAIVKTADLVYVVSK
ncbi:MAG: hypothetical protein PHC54_06680 [Candidatus Omnitrophica bacterium]|nr:hypothetical protein [Candidatus Omnitrophota bacterium]